MVYTSPFLKRQIVRDYDPAADGDYEWELSDGVVAAVWLTVKGDLVAANMCIDDFMLSVPKIDVSMGAQNVVHYSHGIDCLTMNCKLKGHWPYLINSSQTIDDVTGVTFPILFGAPYLNRNMALPKSKDQRKRLVLNVDIATAALDDLLIDIAEVILPGATPPYSIKQEESAISANGTGDLDKWLQRNWDLLKLLIYSPTVPSGATYTSTVEYAGIEIDDVYYGYEAVGWEILHGELMDELEGSGPVEDHIHADPASGNTGMPVGLEHWIAKYGQMDFFYNYDLMWKAPLKNCSTAKFKYNAGVDEAFRITTASLIDNKIHAGPTL